MCIVFEFNGTIGEVFLKRISRHHILMSISQVSTEFYAASSLLVCLMHIDRESRSLRYLDREISSGHRSNQMMH